VNRIRTMTLALALAMGSPLAAAQGFPSKPLRLVVPFAPGGTTDLLARVIAEPLGQALGQTVVVENKAGAGGALGAAEVAKATGDGHVLLMSSVSTMAANPALNPHTPYDPVKDFAHIVNVAATPNVIAVHPGFAARDHAAFLQALRQSPGRFSYGTAGNGSVGHLLAELYKATAKVFVLHIPYRGSGPALNDVVAGQLPIVVDNLPSALPFIKDARLVPMVVAAPRRLAALPQVPTLAEVGMADANRMSFLGVSAPKGTPAAVVEKLNAAIRAVLAQPKVRERIEASGAFVVGNTAQEYQREIADELALYRRVVASQKLRLE
jgi:tripartite-type tricarboxylate transporter receptor subunit TctC